MDKTLPNVSAYTHPTDNRLIFVRRGTPGYWPGSALGIVDDDLTADVWNEAHKITKGEAEAMFAGSLWGWETPAAIANNYDKDGGVIISRLDS